MPVTVQYKDLGTSLSTTRPSEPSHNQYLSVTATLLTLAIKHIISQSQQIKDKV